MIFSRYGTRTGTPRLLVAVVAGLLSAQVLARPAQTDPNPSAKKKTITPPSATGVTQQGKKRPPALKGYCPASFLLQGLAIEGNPAITVSYAGETYYMADEETKKKFTANPKRLSPQFAGLCTTSLGGSYGNRFESDPTVFEIRDEKVYLFLNERAKKGYDTRPEWFIAKAEKLFNKPALEGYSPVAMQTRGKALRGGGSVSTLYRGKFYHFLNKHGRALFLLDPQKYLPQFDAYCTEGASRGRRFVADPKHMVIRDGKLYVFYDEQARMDFLASPDDMMRKAHAYWKTSNNMKP